MGTTGTTLTYVIYSRSGSSLVTPSQRSACSGRHSTLMYVSEWMGVQFQLTDIGQHAPTMILIYFVVVFMSQLQGKLYERQNKLSSDTGE